MLSWEWSSDRGWKKPGSLFFSRCTFYSIPPDQTYKLHKTAMHKKQLSGKDTEKQDYYVSSPASISKEADKESDGIHPASMFCSIPCILHCHQKPGTTRILTVIHTNPHIIWISISIPTMKSNLRIRESMQSFFILYHSSPDTLSYNGFSESLHKNIFLYFKRSWFQTQYSWLYFSENS